MKLKRITSLFIILAMLMSVFSTGVAAYTTQEKGERTVYLHAQGEKPQSTPNVSTVYMGEDANIYFAVDDPNKGDYSNGTHIEPQYDLNGFTVKIYFDPDYFDFASTNTARPIDYNIPDSSIQDSGSGSENVGDDTVNDVPVDVGYFEYKHGSGTKIIGTKTYKTAYATIFYSGGYVPQKNATQLWYNICRLPLKPLKTGSTDVFIDVDGADEYTLELFAKNVTDDYAPNFSYTAINGGYHHIIIRDRLKPSAPVPDPDPGSYTDKFSVGLTAEEGCDIYWSLDGGKTYSLYTDEIPIEITTDITCYALRKSDSKQSNVVTYSYQMVPKAPILFDSNKKEIPNIYNENSAFTVYASDKTPFGLIDDDSEVYYTYAEGDADSFVFGTDPETGWAKLDKNLQTIKIDKKRTVRLITNKAGVLSDVSWYYLGVRPAPVAASPESGEYEEKVDVTLTTETAGAKIYYTTDGSDPRVSGLEYTIPLTFGYDTTLRAVAEYDGAFSEITSYYYLFEDYDDFGVDAFYPSGVYEGEVNVTLTPDNPENDIIYSVDGGKTWNDYDKVLTIDKDTEIIAKAVNPDGDEGGIYVFTYKIKPLPPVFAPESTQFTNSDRITIYSPESNKDNTERYTLYYTTDGTDPITNGKPADAEADSKILEIKGYTVVSAVVLKDGTTWSNVVTHSYDIVNMKPVKPITTLTPGHYTREVGTDEGYTTQFMPVSNGTKIYYTISRGDDIASDPLPGTDYTVEYDGTPIPIEGNTVIKAIAVNVFGVKSDIGIFGYTITPEAPVAAPSASVSEEKLPVVPVTAVPGCTVKYSVNGSDFENEFVTDDGTFYIDTSTGSAYEGEECTEPLGTESTTQFDSQAILDISSELHGVESLPNRYIYTLSDDENKLAPPYADKETGIYNQINIDGNNNFLLVKFYSLNSGDQIQYMLNNSGRWIDYTDGADVAFNEDATLQLRAVRDGKYSAVVSYVYNFVPLPPVITLPSGRYSATPVPTTSLKLDSKAPSNRRYSIFYRENGDKEDVRYTGIERDITHTMSFKAYVIDEATGKKSINTIHYYIIEADTTNSGSVYVANPYDTDRIATHLLDNAPYTDGIKLITPDKNATINYFYTYTKQDGTTVTTNNLIYDNAMPIFVNNSMTDITIHAWLTDSEGNRILNSEMNHPINFVDLSVPVTSLYETGKVEFAKGTDYTIINDYPNDNNIFIYYTLDGTDPDDFENSGTLLYDGSELSINGETTVKTVYFSACGKCIECRDENYPECWSGIWGEVGTYKYTVPTKVGGGSSSSVSGGGGGSTIVERDYTKDIFGIEHPTHIGYINGYPDGSVKPEGNITREEVSAILYRVKPMAYDTPIETTGTYFPDVAIDRWSVREIEHLAGYGIIEGYPDGTFKPANNLTRAEFATLVQRFIKAAPPTLPKDDVEPFPDIEGHWAYDEIMEIASVGLVVGYEDGTFRPEKQITRAEVMSVMNRILGRKPLESYVKSQKFNPFNDLEEDEWYYVTVLEATITHDYHLNSSKYEYLWENCK